MHQVLKHYTGLPQCATEMCLDRNPGNSRKPFLSSVTSSTKLAAIGTAHTKLRLDLWQR